MVGLWASLFKCATVCGRFVCAKHASRVGLVGSLGKRLSEFRRNRKEEWPVYRIKIKIAGKLGELLTQGKGHVVHTSQGDVCVFRSLVHAQYAANLLARYGLLG